jgi:uncharacterized protein (DUF58 family)
MRCSRRQSTVADGRAAATPPRRRLDFDQLREYHEGDAQRKIDWKASQRFARLISRDYQDERESTGRVSGRLRPPHARQRRRIPHFDHALDATLLLAYVGLRQGDAVGLMTMSAATLWLAPHKSQAMIQQMLNAVYGLQPSLLHHRLPTGRTSSCRGD